MTCPDDPQGAPTPSSEPSDAGVDGDPHPETYRRIRQLLAASDLEFEVVAVDDASDVRGALHHWVLRAGDVVEIDIYLCADAADAVAELWDTKAAADADGLPALGQNGALVYVVHHLGDRSDRDSVYTALDVAGLLAGEEDDGVDD